MVPTNKLIIALMISVACSACSLTHRSATLRQEVAFTQPDNNNNLSFFSRMHTSLRDTETATYNLMFRLRDNFDRFVYDTQREFYDHYQK